MKIIIWLLCAFVPSVIHTALRRADIGFGAIDALLLYGPAYWVANRLCIVWDAHKAAKETSEASAYPPEPDHPAELAEPEPSAAELPAEPLAPATGCPNPRFCKHCGDPIDPATRKCTGCGKQHFRPPVFRKKHLALAAATLACVAVALVIFSLANRLNEAELQITMQNSKIQIQNNQISKLEDTVDNLEHQINIYKRNESTYLDKLSEVESEIELFEDRAVIAVIATKVYHTYGCPYLDLVMGYRIYDAFGAKTNGYTPCPHCCS